MESYCSRRREDLKGKKKMDCTDMLRLDHFRFFNRSIQIKLFPQDFRMIQRAIRQIGDVKLCLQKTFKPVFNQNFQYLRSALIIVRFILKRSILNLQFSSIIILAIQTDHRKFWGFFIDVDENNIAILNRVDFMDLSVFL